MSTTRDRIIQRTQKIAQSGKQFASNGVRVIGDGINDLKTNPKIQEGATAVTSTVTTSVRKVGDRFNDIKAKNPKIQEGANVVSSTVSSSVRLVGDRFNDIKTNPRVREGASTVWDVVQELKASEGVKKVNQGVTMLGSKLQSINLNKLIDDEKLADNMERMNRDIQMEKDALIMMKEAEEACLRAITDHFIEFVADSPGVVTYEQWIADLHPENTREGLLLEGMDKEVDHRFYVQDSDHRKLWNAHLGNGRAPVPARSMQTNGSVALSPIDLLDLSYAKFDLVELPRSSSSKNATQSEEMIFLEEEKEAIAMMREAEDRCIRTMEDHFVEFAANRPNATYEQWIADLHPENTRKGQLFRGKLDHRFYLEGSDHRQLWNAHLGCGRKHVAARTTEVVIDDFFGGATRKSYSGTNKVKPWSKRVQGDDLISFDSYSDDLSI